MGQRKEEGTVSDLGTDGRHVEVTRKRGWYKDEEDTNVGSWSLS